jgi:hypothetical protein
MNRIDYTKVPYKLGSFTNGHPHPERERDGFCVNIHRRRRRAMYRWLKSLSVCALAYCRYDAIMYPDFDLSFLFAFSICCSLKHFVTMSCFLSYRKFVHWVATMDIFFLTVGLYIGW